MMSEARQVPRRTRWAIPLTGVVIGVAHLVAGLVGGRPGFGVLGLLLMLTVSGGFLLAARRSETVAGLVDRRDERINAIDRDALLVAGMAVLLAVLRVRR